MCVYANAIKVHTIGLRVCFAFICFSNQIQQRWPNSNHMCKRIGGGEEDEKSTKELHGLSNECAATHSVVCMSRAWVFRTHQPHLSYTASATPDQDDSPVFAIYTLTHLIWICVYMICQRPNSENARRVGRTQTDCVFQKTMNFSRNKRSRTTFNCMSISLSPSLSNSFCVTQTLPLDLFHSNVCSSRFLLPNNLR